ncbi:acetyl-CoA decarbonylase/synthase complex subunit gamma [Desulfacinum hydrothermale DSM 13146]|uniref:Acetyl-CoA decarbonylase/synthase complex subunit gamma n=1 Tax=Desulfacinum hydrothermale DSM 13146 TaxID=1121390 RepID=A0A1W1WXX7_9BACT|nr:acetyl-CoA decarbonylase/synthase complex subunit gamma [Desulfacinum hydrothermale DSM 13146]
MDQPFVIGRVETAAGTIPQVSSQLTGRDRWGTVKARWGVGRMHYTVDPGLYALGEPGSEAPVLVSANYKLSFDHLRSALKDRCAWILVLDTKGINVWCAAGKGTFGTDELVFRVQASGLDRVVNHRLLILPQLSAPGVAAHKVRSRCGFKAVFGPVEARDLPAFLDAGMQATPTMRRKRFGLYDRMVLIPVELVHAFKWLALAAVIFFALAGALGTGSFAAAAAVFGLGPVTAMTTGVFAGAVLTPLLLPWLPGRAFAAKGIWAGLLATALLWPLGPGRASGVLDAVSWILGTVSVAAYLGMNFTGASTYTSLSGVKKEMRWAVPLEIAGFAAFVGLWLTARWTS